MNVKTNEFDVAIVGGGPAGMQAALVLARTRRSVVVFDDPQPPRNAGSHGVHNFLGLEGLLPAEIRKVAWEQIDVYNGAELRHERIVDIRHNADDNFILTNDGGQEVTAKHVVLAFGYQDVYPDIPGFAECWGDTIIPCPFCDGYENRNRTWGIVGTSLEMVTGMPLMAQNWTSSIKVIIEPGIEISSEYEAQLDELGIPIHYGNITGIDHERGTVRGVTLDSGEMVKVETLLWSPSEKSSPLVGKLVDNLGLELDEYGYIAANDFQQTNVPRLWAVGDVLGMAGGIKAAADGGLAASMIIHDWYGERRAA